MKAICRRRVRRLVEKAEAGFRLRLPAFGHVVSDSAGGHRQPARYSLSHLCSILCPRRPGHRRARPRHPHGLLRRGRVSRRHHHRFSHAYSAARVCSWSARLAGFYAAIIAFTFSRNFYLSGLLLAVAGYCMIISVATINSLLQHLAEDHMRGRVMSIYSTAFLGLPPSAASSPDRYPISFTRLTSLPACARWR